MKFAQGTAALIVLTAFACGGQEPHNVNVRYTVESVQIVPTSESRLSPELRRDLDKIVGDKFDPVRLADLSGRIRRELNARMVLNRLSRGAQPEHVKVVFEIVRRKSMELSATRLAYHSRLGFSGGVDATVRHGGNAFTAGVVSDNEELLERFSGFRLRYDREGLGTNRANFRLDVENYHEQWDESTLRGGGLEDIYRSRLNVQPVVTFRMAPGLTLTSGVSLERFETQFPAARTEAANSVVNTLRYRRSWEASDASQSLDAAYTLRAATRTLDSDYVYARHLVSGRYDWRRGQSSVRLTGMGGKISGRAPLFERFALGNSTTLRGWSKYDVQPLGGSRMGYGSAEYRYRILQAFYDCGAVWNPGQKADVKHAIGGGIHTGNLYFSVGFPVRGGRTAPIFVMAMNF